MTGQNADRYGPNKVGQYHHGRCQSHGKIAYASRKGAKMAARRLGEGMSVYVCEVFGIPAYHIGHLPKIVKDGKIDRADLHSRRYQS